MLPNETPQKMLVELMYHVTQILCLIPFKKSSSKTPLHTVVSAQIVNERLEVYE